MDLIPGQQPILAHHNEDIMSSGEVVQPHHYVTFLEVLGVMTGSPGEVGHPARAPAARTGRLPWAGARRADGGVTGPPTPPPLPKGMLIQSVAVDDEGVEAGYRIYRDGRYEKPAPR